MPSASPVMSKTDTNPIPAIPHVHASLPIIFNLLIAELLRF